MFNLEETQQPIVAAKPNFFEGFENWIRMIFQGCGPVDPNRQLKNLILDMDRVTLRDQSLAGEIADKNQEDLEYLVQQGANPNVICREGHSAFQYCMKKQNYVVAEKLLELGAEVNFRTRHGTELYRSIVNYQSENIKKLFSWGANINIQSELSGMTGLHWLCNPYVRGSLIERIRLLKVILSTNKQPTEWQLRDEWNEYTALDYALVSGSFELTSLLLEAGAPLDEEALYTIEHCQLPTDLVHYLMTHRSNVATLKESLIVKNALAVCSFFEAQTVRSQQIIEQLEMSTRFLREELNQQEQILSAFNSMHGSSDNSEAESEPELEQQAADSDFEMKPEYPESDLDLGSQIEEGLVEDSDDFEIVDSELFNQSIGSHRMRF